MQTPADNRVTSLLLLDGRTQVQLTALLTPEQQAALRAYKPEPTTQLDYLAQFYHFTPQQRAQADLILQASDTQREAILHLPGLSEEERAQRRQAITEDTDTKIRAIAPPKKPARDMLSANPWQ
jgi:hypothetical protein